LTAAESREFWRKFAALPHDDSGRSSKQELGYRGVIVSGEEAGRGSREEIVISGGIVQRESSQGIQTFADKGRTLERWLVETGKDNLEPDIYREVAIF
jgi:hypothetical protein